MSKRDGMVLTMLDVFTLCARDDLLRLHELVVAIDDEGRRDPQAMIAGILVMESAGNVLNAFNRMQSAADGVLRAVQGCPLAGSPR